MATNNRNLLSSLSFHNRSLASIFGGVDDVNFRFIVITFIAVLIAIICLESIFNKAERYAKEAGHEKLYNKMQRELVNMGLISFAVFILESASSLDRKNDWFISFEIIHIIIVFMGFAFLFQAFFLMGYAQHFKKKQVKALEASSKELLDQYDKLLVSSLTLTSKRSSSSSSSSSSCLFITIFCLDILHLLVVCPRLCKGVTLQIYEKI